MPGFSADKPGDNGTGNKEVNPVSAILAAFPARALATAVAVYNPHPDNHTGVPQAVTKHQN
jgi:hypothetical protein